MTEGLKKYEKNIRWIIIIFVILLISTTVSTRKLNKYRDICNQHRERLIETETTNRELENRLIRITETTGRLAETANANITNARDIIETVEKLRVEIQELENICYGGNTIDDYYNYWDSIYRDEQLMD